MEELFGPQTPAPGQGARPTGVMPGTPEFDEEAVSPEEQDQYDQLVNKAIDFIGSNAEQVVAGMNDKQRPVFESVGEMTVKIAEMVVGSAKAAQVEISPEVLHGAGQEIVEHLMELGDASGIFPFDQKSNEYDETMSMAFLHATKVYGEGVLQGPEYNDGMKEDAGNFMAQQVAGEVQRGEAPRQTQVAGGVQTALQGG